MEDDIDIKKDPHELTLLIEKLDQLVGKDGWDVLFTDPDTKNNNGTYVPCYGYARKPNFEPKNPTRFHQKTRISEDFTQVGARYGAYSMIIKRSGMKKILDFIKTYKIFLPYDMEFYLCNNIKLYSLNYDLVSTKIKAKSDNGAPNYLNEN